MRSRIFILAAAMTPLLAVAGGGDKLGVKTDELKDDWRLSEIIGSEVQSSDGQTVGEVQDVLLSEDGRVEALQVSADDGMTRQASVSTTEGVERGAVGDGAGQVVAEDRTQVGMRNTGAERDKLVTQTGEDGADAAASLGQAGDSRVAAAAMTDDADLTSVSWDSPQFDEQNGVVTVQSSQMQTVSAEDSSSATSASGKHKASELMEMEVALSDEDSFGNVEDVLVSSDGEVSALVVNAGGFMSEEQYALPADFENVSAEEGVIRYDLARADVEQAKIDLDELQRSASQGGQ